MFRDWLSVYNSPGFDLRFTNNKVFVAALHVRVFNVFAPLIIIILISVLHYIPLFFFFFCSFFHRNKEPAKGVKILFFLYFIICSKAVFFVPFFGLFTLWALMGLKEESQRFSFVQTMVKSCMFMFIRFWFLFRI